MRPSRAEGAKARSTNCDCIAAPMPVCAPQLGINRAAARGSAALRPFRQDRRRNGERGRRKSLSLRDAVLDEGLHGGALSDPLRPPLLAATQASGESRILSADARDDRGLQVRAFQPFGSRLVSAPGDNLLARRTRVRRSCRRPSRARRRPFRWRSFRRRRAHGRGALISARRRGGRRTDGLSHRLRAHETSNQESRQNDRPEHQNLVFLPRATTSATTARGMNAR